MKYPTTTDGVNYSLYGCCVYVLAEDDIIHAGDFVRDIVETGYNGGFDTTFKSDNWRGLRWHRVNVDFSGWTGKTYKEYLDFIKSQSIQHEIVRIVPAEIQLELKLLGKI